MRISFFIAGKFIKAHKHTALLGVLIISLFVAAFEASLMYNSCYAKTVEDNILKQYGEEAGIIYNADISKSARLLSEPSDGMTVFCGYDAVYSESLDNKFYIGYLPEKALLSKHREVTEGRLPEKEGEAAIEESAYNSLSLTADIGDTFTVTVRQNGEKVDKSFTLCGKIESYLLNWQNTDITKKSFTYPPPVILTVQQVKTPAYIDIMCNYAPESGNYLGGEYSDTFMTLNHSSVKAQIESVKIVTIPLAVFIVLIMILGIYGVLQYIMKEYDKYVRLLGCIGMPLRMCIPIYLITALGTMISASIIGSGAGYAVTFVFCRLFSKLVSGQETLFVYDARYAFFGCMICSIVILLVFAFSVIKYYKKLENSFEKKPRRARKHTEPFVDAVSLTKLWNKAQSRINFSQRLLSGLLMFLCVAVVGVGLFGVEISVISEYQSAARESGNGEDIALYIPGGGTAQDIYNINLPEGSGVSAENLKELTDMGLDVVYSSLSANIGVFIFYDPSDPDPYMENCIRNRQYLTERETPTLDYALKAAGGDNSGYLITGKTAVKNYAALKDYGVDHMSKEAFESGKIIAAPASYYNVGDKLTILTVSSVDPEKSADDPEKFLFHKDEYTVGALSGYDYYILCADYLSDIHKEAKFDIVVLSVGENKDDEYIKTVTEKAEAVVSRCQYTSLDNRLQQSREYRDASLSTVTGFGIVLLIFELMAMTAIIISAKLKTKGDMLSLILLKQIGADSALLVKLSALTNMKTILFSGGAAAILCTALIIERTRALDYLPLSGLAAICIAVFALLTVLTALLSYIISKREITRSGLFRNAGGGR